MNWPCDLDQVDFPELVRNKHILIQNHEELSCLLDIAEEKNKESPHIGKV